MGETSVPITAGSGTNVDAFLPAGGNYRQAVVFADPTTSANIVPVQTTDPNSNSLGAVVRDVNTSAIAGFLAGTLGIYLQSTAGTLGVALKAGTIAVSLDPGHTLGSVLLKDGSGTNLTTTSSNLDINLKSVNGTTPTTPTAGIMVINDSHTMSVFTTSGSATGITVSGNTIISPSASYNFKIFALALTTTAQTQIVAKFTNGNGGSPTELWRYALQAPAQGVAGANLSVPAPSFLFATGTNNTLSLVLDSGSLVHYSVSYIKESA